MKVILNSDVANLGEEGDIREVAPGYARNYLLPKGLVLEHNERNLAVIEERRSEIESRKARKRADAASVKEQIESTPLVVKMTAGANGKLFGSVNGATIVEQLAARGVSVEKKRVEVPENAIKTTGNFKVRIKLYGDEEAILTVTVESESQEKANAKKVLGEETPAAQEEAPAVDASAEEALLSSNSTDPEVIAMEAAAAEGADAEEDAE